MIFIYFKGEMMFLNLKVKPLNVLKKHIYNFVMENKNLMIKMKNHHPEELYQHQN
jgi:hypothetical protein